MIFQGNDHLIYNGSFFYLNKKTEKIIRYPIATRRAKEVLIPKNRVVQNSGKLRDNDWN
jgi:hypothetical protein